MDPYLPEGEIMDKGTTSYGFPNESVIVNQFLYSFKLILQPLKFGATSSLVKEKPELGSYSLLQLKPQSWNLLQQTVHSRAFCGVC